MKIAGHTGRAGSWSALLWWRVRSETDTDFLGTVAGAPLAQFKINAAVSSVASRVIGDMIREF